MAVRRGGRGVVAALLAVTAITACEPPLRQHAGTFTSATITRDGNDHYDLTPSAGGLRVSAPTTNQSGNLRMIIVRDETPAWRDHQSCVTWTGPSTGIIQPGVALRIRTTRTRTRAVTVTNNVLFGMRGSFNVHVMDSRAWTPQADNRLRLVGRVWADWANDPLPWRMCARVQGSRVTVKAWSLATTPTEPPWDDPDHAGVVKLPAVGVYTGRPGWYVGHLNPGQGTSFTKPTYLGFPLPA